MNHGPSGFIVQAWAIFCPDTHPYGCACVSDNRYRSVRRANVRRRFGARLNALSEMMDFTMQGNHRNHGRAAAAAIAAAAAAGDAAASLGTAAGTTVHVIASASTTTTRHKGEGHHQQRQQRTSDVAAQRSGDGLPSAAATTDTDGGTQAAKRKHSPDGIAGASSSRRLAGNSQ